MFLSVDIGLEWASYPRRQGLLRELHCNGAGAAQHDKFLGLAQDCEKSTTFAPRLRGGFLRKEFVAGCSAARLACVVRDDEVGSSNLPTPTVRNGTLYCSFSFYLRNGEFCFFKTLSD